MKTLRYFLLALGLSLYSAASSSSPQCPLIDSKDESDRFIKAVQAADYSLKNKRYSFVYQGDTWFMEEKHYKFLTQEDVSKFDHYAIDKIESKEPEQKGQKLRCHYIAHCEYLYGEGKNDKFQHPFHMTKFVKE